MRHHHTSSYRKIACRTVPEAAALLEEDEATAALKDGLARMRQWTLYSGGFSVAQLVAK
jgi:hypothetical protein